MLLGGTQAIEEALEMLTENDFYFPGHSQIFCACADLSAQGKPIDLVTVAEFMRNNKTLDQVGGPVYLAQLSQLGLPANIKFYAEQVRQYSLMRQLLTVAQSIESHCYEKDLPFDEVMSEVEKSLTSLNRDVRTIDPKNASNTLYERWTYLEESKENPDTGLVKTLFPDLDKYLGGVPKGDFVLIGARPSMGKSGFALQWALNAARKRNITAFFSLEMSEPNIADRLSALELDIDSLTIRRRLFEDKDITRAIAASNALSQIPLYIDCTSGITTRDLFNACRKMKRTKGLDIVFVDYLGRLVNKQRSNQSRNDVVGEMSRDLKDMAKELDIVMVVLSQLSRVNEFNRDKTPSLASLRESGNLEQDADTVIFIHRPDYYDPDDQPNMAQFIIAKQRNGPTGTATLQFNKRLARFESIAREGFGQCS